MKQGLRIVTLIGAAMLLFSMVSGLGILAPPITLLFGWAPAFARLCRTWHPGATGTILFVLALLIVVAGSHLFLRWVYGGLHSKEGSRRLVDEAGLGTGTVPQPAADDGCATLVWRWKWTLCGFGIFVFTLVAISCLVLTTHQIYWISKSSDPLLTDPFREKAAGHAAGLGFLNKAEEMGWETSRVRDAFCKMESPAAGQLALDKFQPVWIPQDEHRLRALILVPRRTLYRDRAAFIIIQPDSEIVMRKLDDLPQVLSSFGIESPRGQSPGLIGLRP